MREILFRGKTKNGEWFYGGYFKTDNEDYIITNSRVKDFYDLWDIAEYVVPETVGQYTGLTDKNGKKIFEGDIVKTKYGRLCFVEWRSTPCFCGFDLSVYANWNTLDKAPSGWDLYVPENLEVVGNIHDNTELLGE